MKLSMNLNLTSDGVAVEELVASSEIRAPFQVWSMNSISIPLGPAPSAHEHGVQLAIDPDRLAQAAFDIAAQKVADRNREALTELAKW